MFNNFPHRFILTAATVLFTPAFVGAQTVEAWPDKPVKLIVPFTSGGPTDTVARIITTGLQAIWKQPVVIDYKPGAEVLRWEQALSPSHLLMATRLVWRSRP